jgi:hypothetical protein
MSPVQIGFSKAGIAVAITRGTRLVHTTRIHIFPWEYVLGAIVLIAVIIWIVRRGRSSPK